MLLVITPLVENCKSLEFVLARTSFLKIYYVGSTNLVVYLFLIKLTFF